MAVDRNAPHLGPLRALLGPAQWEKFEQLVEVSTLGNVEVDGIETTLKAMHMSENERQLIAFAYAVWRGFGPGLDVQHFWGMDRQVAARIMAAMAMAVEPQAAASLLQQASELVPQPETELAARRSSG